MNEIRPIPSQDQQACLDALRTQAQALNKAIARAVEAGFIIEVTRASRHHANGGWGDQITAAIQPRT